MLPQNLSGDTLDIRLNFGNGGRQ